MRRFGVILTDQGKSIAIRIAPQATTQQRKEAYDCYATNYLESILFSKNEQNQVIPESITLVPVFSQVNTLNYEDPK